MHDLPTLRLNDHQRTNPENHARLSHVPVLSLQHLFNERTGTPFNFLAYPTDVVLLVVVWRLRYKLSLRERSRRNVP